MVNHIRRSSKKDHIQPEVSGGGEARHYSDSAGTGDRMIPVDISGRISRKSLIDRLEARAHALRQSLARQDGPTPRSVIQQDIAFTSEQLDRLRQIHKAQLDSIRAEEFELEQRLHWLNQYDREGRERLTKRMATLSVERRRWMASQESDLERLHEKLVSLFTQFDYLADNGH